MNKIKFIYFDVGGGVLFEFKSGLENLSVNLNCDYKKVEEIFYKYDDDMCRGKMPCNELKSKYLAISKNKLNDFNFIEFWTSNFKPIVEMHVFLRKLSKRYDIGLLTNIYDGVYEIAYTNGSIPNVNYKQVIQSCNYGYVKPEIEIYEIAQDLTGYKPNEVLFVDDSEKNIKAGKSVGWNTFLFNAANIDKLKKVLL